jgi:AcrR family transcriptional regulator
VAGYGPTDMVQTPWGEAGGLRERMLRPGPGMPREEVARSQRERLFAAAVACVTTSGYEATTVADLLELSGVSRSAFYVHFHDKEDCVLATFDAIVAKSLEAVGGALDKDTSGEQRARDAVRTMLEMIVTQPGAANLCFYDIYTVGERGRLAAERSMTRLTPLAAGAFAEIRDGKEPLPEEMIQGVLGAAQLLVQFRLRQGEVDSLPDLAEDLYRWALSYEAPTTRLRLAGRRTRPIEGPPPFVAYSQAERILRALAAAAGERGYPAVTIAEIAARASVSQATFYSYFADKDAALAAALDSAGSQMLGVVMPAARRAPDWTNGIRAAIGAMFGFYAAEPDFARLAAVETRAAGTAVLDRRDQRIAQVRTLLDPGLEAVPDMNRTVADAALATMWSLLYNTIVSLGPESLPQFAPLASYMVLTPFIGADEAVKIANGDGRGQTQ